jgi:hypothetical protein
MGQGRRPDAASLAALSAWAGLNPADFVGLGNRTTVPEPLAQISTLLRSDPRLNEGAATALDSMLKSAYQQLKNKPESKSSSQTAPKSRGLRRGVP